MQIFYFNDSRKCFKSQEHRRCDVMACHSEGIDYELLDFSSFLWGRVAVSELLWQKLDQIYLIVFSFKKALFFELSD